MKQNKLWAMLLGALALTACSKDADVAPSSLQPTDEPKTMIVDANLSVGEDDDNLRVLFNLVSDDTGATMGLAMAEKNVKIRVAIKRGTGEPVYNDLTFTKVVGQNRATYAGQITVPAEGTGDYMLSAVLLGEEGGKTFATPHASQTHRVNLTPSNRVLVRPQSGEKLDINVPYIAKWTQVSLNAEGTTLAPVTIMFEPQGTILRFRIKNNTAQTYSIKQVNFVSTALDPSVNVWFNEENTLNPGYPKLLTTELFGPFAFKFSGTDGSVPAKVGDTPGLSPWFYIWVMPTEAVDPQTEVNLITTTGEKISNVFATRQALPYGSVPVTLTIGASGHSASFGDVSEVPGYWGATPKVALDYVAEYDYNADGTDLVRNHDLAPDNLGFFTWADAVAKFSTPRKLSDDKTYSIPTAAEMHSIFPQRYFLYREGETESTQLFSSSMDGVNKLERNIKIGNRTQNYFADYKSEGSNDNRVTYAIRFKDNKGDYNRTAFRYKLEKVADNHYQIVVTARYLGNKPAVTLATIAVPTYWETDTQGDVIRTFVLRKYRDYNPNYDYPNLITKWWTATPYDPHYRARSISLMNTTGFVAYDDNRNAQLVRPFLRD